MVFVLLDNSLLLKFYKGKSFSIYGFPLCLLNCDQDEYWKKTGYQYYNERNDVRSRYGGGQNPNLSKCKVIGIDKAPDWEG